jgi:hypothetical protein
MQVIHNHKEYVLEKYRKMLAEEGKMLAEPQPKPQLKLLSFPQTQREERGDE